MVRDEFNSQGSCEYKPSQRASAGPWSTHYCYGNASMNISSLSVMSFLVISRLITVLLLIQIRHANDIRRANGRGGGLAVPLTVAIIAILPSLSSNNAVHHKQPDENRHHGNNHEIEQQKDHQKSKEGNAPSSYPREGTQKNNERANARNQGHSKESVDHHGSSMTETTTLSEHSPTAEPTLKLAHNLTAHSLSLHKRPGGASKRKGHTNNNWHELSSYEHSISSMLRCQELDTKALLPSATTCKNLRTDKVCNYLFAPVDLKSGRRDVKCNLQGLEDIAESCRRTCGICCEDINYACEDDINGIIDCSKQLDKCHQKKWFGVLSRFCAGSCGLCAMSKCRDFDNSCRVRKALCLKEESMDYMRENCARTCGFCIVGVEGETSISGTGGGEDGEGGETLEIGIEGGDGEGKAIVPINGKVVSSGRLGKSNGGKSWGTTQRQIEKAHRRLIPDCEDKANNCTINESLCGSPIHAEFMIKFCTKTCLKCGKSQGPSPEVLEVSIQPMMGRDRKTRLCEDRNKNCATWSTNGFCSNDKYTQEQRFSICPKACNLC